MKNIFFPLLLLFICCNLYAGSNDSLLNAINNKIDTIQKQVVKNEKQIVLIQSQAEEKKGFINENFSAIIALLIGLITVFVNVWLNKSLRKQNSESLNKQIESSEKIAIKNIQNTELVTLKNIENSKELSKLEFNANLKRNNRQDWVNALKDNLAQLSKNLYSLQFARKNSESDYDKIDAYRLNILYHITFILLHIDTELELHNKLKKTIFNSLEIIYSSTNDNIDVNAEIFTKKIADIIIDGNNLINEEWKAIQQISI